MSVTDIVNRIYREFKRYTGDGLPGEPTGAPLPVGDPQSGPYSPKKSELRAAFIELFGIGEELVDDLLSRYLGALPNDAAATAAAGTPVLGQMYFNSTDGKFRVWNGAAWQDQSIAVSDGSITGLKLADGAVTEVKAASSFKAKILGVAADRAALAAMNGTTYLAVDLMEAGRKGLFTWNAADLSGTLLGPAITTTAVNSTTETATKAAHGLFTGQPVIVTEAVNGLAVNTVYYAIRVTIDTFRLATTFANAIDEVAFNLTGTTNFTVKRHYDPLQIAYVTPVADISGASGAWVRQFDGDVYATWGGLTSAGAAKDNIHAVNMAVILADRLKRGVSLPGFQFDVYVGTNGGVALLKGSEIRGQGHSTILNAVAGGTASQLRNYQAGAVIRRHFNFTSNDDLNSYVDFCLVEHLAVVLNHPNAAVTTSQIQIAIDLRNVSRSTIRNCWIGNYHPTADAKGISRSYLAQGYGIVCGTDGGTYYAGGEVNRIEDNNVAGAWRAIVIDDNLLSPQSAAYSTRIERNDVSVASVLVLQGSQYGAANVIRHNVLQATQARAGDAHPDGGIYIEGYGNLIEEVYGEYGADCPFILRLGSGSKNNRAVYSAVCSVSGGVVTEGGHYGFRDAGGSSSRNVIEFFANEGSVPGGYFGMGTPQRMISGATTTQT